MKYVIDIPQSYYEQIQEYPQQIWIGRDIIKPLQTELEEIKSEMEEAESYFANNGDTLYGIQVAIHILNNRTQGENKEN